MQLSLDPLSQLSQLSHFIMELRSEPSATWHWRIQRPREPQLPTPKMRYGTTLPTAHICPPKHPEKGWKKDSPKYIIIHSVVICRIHAHIHISTDWLWHAFDDVGTCWACFFPKRKWLQANSAEKWNEESIKHSDHQQPLEPGGPPLIHLPKSPNMQKPWRDRTLKTSWIKNNHKQKVKKLPAPVGIMKVFRPTQDSQEISSFDMYRYVIITNLLLQPSYWTGPSECFQRKNMVFPPSTCHHMIIWSTTGYPEVQGCACLPIFLGHPHVKNEPTAICMHPEHHDHWYGHILYAAT